MVGGHGSGKLFWKFSFVRSCDGRGCQRSPLRITLHCGVCFCGTWLYQAPTFREMGGAERFKPLAS